MKKIWKNSAPSNIALVKYMGKEAGNVATNPSVSMTLEDFRTFVEIEPLPGETHDRWEPLPDHPPLKAGSTDRFLRFFGKLKADAGVDGSFLLRSGNNFPSDAGLASSASSFAALTRTAWDAFSDLTGKPVPPSGILARESRAGSGSSCRSFFSPWCSWNGDEIQAVPSRLPRLVDLVVVAAGDFKKVSSSEAHLRVQTSPLFRSRAERAGTRWRDALDAIAAGDFRRTAEISWAELWDMHSLFHTSEPPFFYFAPLTVAVLRLVEELWEKNGTAPIATIDAGPNVHLLIPEEEAATLRLELESRLPA
ncbi:MAG: diphosphomevalonate decarboxylase, partial [Bdellovibrionales bacterium]|nr:diphosphomevalonate decarboxylase [Bdellovibrionales bacterium]